MAENLEALDLFDVADGHAPPALEPSRVAFHGVARLIPFRSAGLAAGDGANSLGIGQRDAPYRELEI